MLTALNFGALRVAGARALLVLAAVLAPIAAWAEDPLTPYNSTVAIFGSDTQVVEMGCPDIGTYNGVPRAVVEPCGGPSRPIYVAIVGGGNQGGTISGTVTANQGAPGSQPWLFSDSILESAVRTNDSATTRVQTHDDQLSGTIKVVDSNSAAFQGVVVITPGTPVTAARSIGYVCTAAGTMTLTLADTSTIALTISIGSFATLPFAVTNVALSNGAAGTFWNLK